MSLLILLRFSWILGLQLLLTLACCAEDPARRTVTSPVTATSALSDQVTQSCLDCHAGDDAEARLDLEGMLGEPLAGHLSDWRKVLRVVRDGSMPPQEAAELSEAGRTAFVNEMRALVTRTAQQHARDPGPTVVRRLTSAEFDYCLEDLTGLQLGLGNQFVSDSVGGSGFTNSASAQFLQDAMLERYLEAAKTVANHAMIGAGPLHFYEAAGQTGMELSAIERIQHLNRQYGFRAAAGEGAEPYGLERFPRALEVAWKYRHRDKIGDEARSLDQLAVEADLDPKFVHHLWNALNQPDPRFPLSQVISSWNDLPIPNAGDSNSTSDDGESSIAELCRELFQQVQRWQERFAGAASAEEEAAVLTGGKIVIPSSRAFLVRARRKRLQLDDNFTPDLNDPRLYSKDGTVRLRITVEPASEPREPVPSVIMATPTFQFRYLEQVDPEPVSLRSIVTPHSQSKLKFGENIGRRRDRTR